MGDMAQENIQNDERTRTDQNVTALYTRTCAEMIHSFAKARSKTNTTQ